MIIGSATTTSARTAVRLAVLPELELRVGDARLELRPASLRLIGFLSLQHGRPVARGVVSSALWPDVSDVKAGASLRSAIWRLGPPGRSVVGASSTHVWLEPDVEVDLWAAEECATGLLTAGALGPGDPVTEAVPQLVHDVLVGWFEDWALAEQERFRQLRLHALDRLGALLLEAGRPGEAIRVGQVAVVCEPFRETAQTVLVQAHLAEGNVVEAVRQFRSFATLLSAELGIGPSRRLAQLVDEALVGAERPVRSRRGGLARPRLAR